MTTRAHAAICRGHDHPFTIEPVELADLRPDEVLVRVVACGICHTDLAVRDAQLPVPLPVVLGHEGAGIVEAVGDGVVDAGGVGEEAEEAGHVAGADAGDLLDKLGEALPGVEARAVGPAVAAGGLDLLEGQVVGPGAPGGGEELVDHPGHGEERRPGVEGVAGLAH